MTTEINSHRPPPSTCWIKKYPADISGWFFSSQMNFVNMSLHVKDGPLLRIEKKKSQGNFLKIQPWNYLPTLHTCTCAYIHTQGPKYNSFLRRMSLGKLGYFEGEVWHISSRKLRLNIEMSVLAIRQCQEPSRHLETADPQACGWGRDCDPEDGQPRLQAFFTPGTAIWGF